MKAITLLTMAFLPATFVATVFSMGFFEFSSDADGSGAGVGLVVSPKLWVYFAITVPLTMFVLGICAIWLKWNAVKLRAEEGGRETRR